MEFYNNKKSKTKYIPAVLVVLLIAVLGFGFANQYMKNQQALNKNAEKKDVPDVVLDNRIEVDDKDKESLEDLIKGFKVTEDTKIIFYEHDPNTGKSREVEIDVPIEMQGLSVVDFNDAIQEEYPQWAILAINSNNAKLYREYSSEYSPALTFDDEDKKLKDDDVKKNEIEVLANLSENKKGYLISSEENKIVVYEYDEDGELIVYFRSDISLDDIPESELDNINEGIELESIDEVMSLIENYDS